MSRQACNNIFTRMQDDSNLRWPSKNTSAKGKCIYPNLRQTPKIKHLLKKNILLLISYTKCTKYVRFYLPLSFIVTVSIFTVGAFFILTYTPNIPILFTAIPQHIDISDIHWIGYTRLLKTLHSPVWWDSLQCHYDHVA